MTNDLRNVSLRGQGRYAIADAIARGECTRQAGRFLSINSPRSRPEVSESKPSSTRRSALRVDAAVTVKHAAGSLLQTPGTSPSAAGVLATNSRRSIDRDNSRWYFDNSNGEVGEAARVGRKPRKAAVARGSLSIIFSTAQREINVG